MHQLVAVTRRLAAIAFADVAGWSRLMEQNDVEGWRMHYAVTCRMWLERLVSRKDELSPILGDGRGGQAAAVSG